MKVAGFTIIRNARKYDYPVLEAILSVLPLCDAFYVGVGQSDDDTREMIEGIPSGKIVIVDSVWDDSLREGGQVLSIETNKVFDAIPEEFDWCFYIQSDECVHEDDLKGIKQKMLLYKDDDTFTGITITLVLAGAGTSTRSASSKTIKTSDHLKMPRDSEPVTIKN